MLGYQNSLPHKFIYLYMVPLIEYVYLFSFKAIQPQRGNGLSAFVLDLAGQLVEKFQWTKTWMEHPLLIKWKIKITISVLEPCR